MVERRKPQSMHHALVVEDNEHVCHMLDFMLQRAGYDVTAINNGKDAQSAIEKLQPVDVILMDLMLPYVSGFQLISEIRANAAWHLVPIVVLSGKVVEDDIVMTLDMGANDYVTRPFRPDELLARIRRVVTERELPGTAT